MRRLPWRSTNAIPVDRVTPLEIFFDLVFVFTLTQLTRILEEDLSFTGIGRVLLLFGVLWWIYSGYAWLANHAQPGQLSYKLWLFVAMAGFLITAVGVPHAFDGTGMFVGLGFCIVTSVHLILFMQSDARAGRRRVAPFNLGAALLILAASFTSGTAVYILWIAAFALQCLAPYLIPQHSWVGVAQSFQLAPEHFVERHGLLVIIALGESVVAIGRGVDVAHLTVSTLGVIVLALALPAALWWTYYSDTAAIEHVLANADTRTRNLLAARTYIFAHIPLLLGIIVTAAGIHAAIAHPGEPAEWTSSLALVGGVAAFLLGVAEFRRHLAIGSPISRLVAAVAVLALIPLASTASAGLQLALVVGVIAAMLVNDARMAAAEAASEAA